MSRTIDSSFCAGSTADPLFWMPTSRTAYRSPISRSVAVSRSSPSAAVSLMFIRIGTLVRAGAAPATIDNPCARSARLQRNFMEDPLPV